MSEHRKRLDSYISQEEASEMNRIIGTVQAQVITLSKEIAGLKKHVRKWGFIGGVAAGLIVTGGHALMGCSAAQRASEERTISRVLAYNDAACLAAQHYSAALEALPDVHAVMILACDIAPTLERAAEEFLTDIDAAVQAKAAKAAIVEGGKDR